MACCLRCAAIAKSGKLDDMAEIPKIPASGSLPISDIRVTNPPPQRPRCPKMRQNVDEVGVSRVGSLLSRLFGVPSNVDWGVHLSGGVHSVDFLALFAVQG